MSETTQELGAKIANAVDLQSVVRTMKAMAASSIAQYERAVLSLQEYDRSVRLALSAALHQTHTLDHAIALRANPTGATIAVVFGSDQGLIGAFNERLAGFVKESLSKLGGNQQLWIVGERLQTSLVEHGFPPTQHFALPGTIGAITPLVGAILVQLQAVRKGQGFAQVLLFCNQPTENHGYAPTMQTLLPLGAVWLQELQAQVWHNASLPDILPGAATGLEAFLHAFLFVSLFRACAESLASENASRLTTMQRAEQNIDTLLMDLNVRYHRLRQDLIDEELFDVVAGFEALIDEGPGR